MRTLVVGDLHLLETVVLPIVEEKAVEHGVNRIVLVGDYFDQWRENMNSKLYQRELNYLVAWTIALRDRGIEVICLLGNHDVPYLTGNLKYYSIQDEAIGHEIREKLLTLGVQVAFETDDYLISHAGFAGKASPEEWYFHNISLEHMDELDKLENTVGDVRGGSSELGSVLWADYVYELAPFYNQNYPKQIVGHTPVRQVMKNEEDGTIFGIDTFSLYQNHEPIGNGDLLLIEDGQVRALSTTISKAISKANATGDLFRLI
jgi:DNA repair exonuclease SbcCD nuclease subunit